nr:hypothetical protein CFP56_67415 [Quercus suber]
MALWPHLKDLTLFLVSLIGYFTLLMLDHATYMYVCLVMSLIGSLFTMLVTLILPCALFPEHCERENNPVAVSNFQ